MLTVSKYVFLDLLKNRSILVYTLVLAVLSFTLLGLDGNSANARQVQISLSGRSRTITTGVACS